MPVNPNSTSPATASTTTTTSASKTDDRKYILHAPQIRLHPIWRAKGFWESALFERIAGELGLFQPVLWDDLTPEQLREAVAGNIDEIFLIISQNKYYFTFSFSIYI